MRTPYWQGNCKEVFLLPFATGKEKALKICADQLLHFFTDNRHWPNLVTVVCCTCCRTYLEHIKSIELTRKESFPILIGVYCVPPKFEFCTHEANVYYTNAHVVYFLKRNREKIRSALLLYFCIQKRYPFIDRNVVRKICREYTNHVSEIPCKEEDEIRKVWRKAKLEKLEQSYKEKGNTLSNELERITKRELAILDEIVRIRDKRIRVRDGVETNSKYLEQIEKMKEF